jgi:hypothetical protein
MANGHGGARKGGGRKSAHDEMKSRELAITAIVSKFGSLEGGMQFLIETEEPSLIKFVFEHAVGKPKDTLDIDAKVDANNQVIYIGKKKK